MPHPIAYSVEGAAEASTLGRTVIYEAMADGRLRRQKFGRRTLILHDDLVAFLNAGTDTEAGEAL